MKFYPEGKNPELLAQQKTLDELMECMNNGEVLESKVLLCDREHNLHTDLGAIRGIIPRVEGATGIESGEVRDIALISRVNKNVCFVIKSLARDEYGNDYAVLSRREVQERCIQDYLNCLKIGDVIDARVTHLERFGAFIDIGAGVNSLIPIDMLSVSRIGHPNQRLREGQDIRAVLRKREDGKLTFSLKELLGTWQENVDKYSVGETVMGVVRSIEEYGVFVELAPNLAGLAEPQPELEIGQEVAVFIKSIIPDKMKLKLIIVEAFDSLAKPQELEYLTADEHIDFWQYSPNDSVKQIFTNFAE